MTCEGPRRSLGVQVVRRRGKVVAIDADSTLFSLPHVSYATLSSPLNCAIGCELWLWRCLISEPRGVGLNMGCLGLGPRNNTDSDAHWM